jgi:hypothetical protein
MFENRVRDWFASPVVTALDVEFQPAFVACPAPLFGAYGPVHQAFVAEVYRRAQEQTEAQFREPPRRRWIPEFSPN